MNFSVENTTAILIKNLCNNENVFDFLCDALVVGDVILGLLLNARVVWLLLRGIGGHVTSDILAFNLAFSELIICPCIFFTLLHHVKSDIRFYMPAIGFCFEFVQVSRPLFRCCICVDRYLAVVHPVVFLKFKQLKYRLELLLTVWFITLLFCTVSIFYAIPFQNTVIFLPVLTVDSFCSISILRALRRPRPGEGEQEEMNLMKRRAFRTVLVFQVMMMFNYLPMIVTTSFALIIDPKYQCHFFSLAYTLLVLGSFVDPLFYFSRLGKLPCTKKR